MPTIMTDTMKIQSKATKKSGLNTLLAVYKTGEKRWRGFAYPFDVTVESDTRNTALLQLRDLVSDYEDFLKEYNYPDHLANKELSFLEDRVKFNEILHDSRLNSDIGQKTGSEDCYVETSSV